MTNKTTKKALWMSVLSLILCFSMLVSTTFAWFTDSVESKVNTIVAGNLDIEVYYAYPSDVVNGDVPADAWKKVTADKSLFNNEALWEPGYTEVVFLKFVNEGSLALQYQMNVDILKEVYGKTKDGADIQLSKYINAYICNNFEFNYKQFLFTDREAATNPAGAPNPYYDTLYNAATMGVNRADNYTENGLSLDSWQWLEPAETTYATMVLWMPTTVGNEANHDGKNIPSIDLGITVVATQKNYENEKDSFGPDYDKDAKFPDVPVTVTTKPAGEAASVKDPDEQIVVEIPADAPAGEYKVNVGPKTYSTDDEGNTVVSMEIDLLRDGQKDSTTACPVVVDLGVGLTGLKIVHDGAEVTDYEYNPTTGMVSFTTTFSPFEFSYVDGKFAAVTETAGYQTLQDAIDAAVDGDVITLLKDITEDVTVVQQPGVKITIDGNKKTIAGVIVVDGKSGTYTTAGLTIKNVNFKAESISADACIRLGDGTNATRYTCNVTVENCTFDVPGAVGVKSYTGGDKNLTIKNCTTSEAVHSLGQLKGIDGILIEDCTVNSIRGVNFNNSDNVTINKSTFNVKKYAVRFGESNNSTVENFTITNSKLESTCEEDAVIVVRAGATNANLNLSKTELDGPVLFMGTTADTNVLIDGKYCVTNADALVAALARNEDVLFGCDIKIEPAKMSNAYGKTGINVNNGQTIDGNGYTLNIKGAGGTWDSGINTTGGVIKNIKVTGSFRGIFINHNSTYSETVVLENVIIEGTTYTISCDQGLKQGLEAYNCTFNGWTSYAATLGNVKFVGCNFGYGAGYKFMRPYAPTEFVNCNFTAEGYAMDPRAAVTFENCTLNSVALTAENLATLVTSNIANATVK